MPLGTGPVLATEQEQAEFFARIQEGFLAAAARTGEIVYDVRLAGTLIRLYFAGDALLPVILPGLATTETEVEAGCICEIHLWDSESTGIRVPPPPRPWKDFTKRGNIWGFESSRYRSAYHCGEGSINVMDRQTRQAGYWVPAPQHVPAWALAAPLRSILHWWMELNGRQLAHAASVGCDGRGVLIPGRSGSGKSSTALACLNAGMDFVSDDYVALALQPEPRMYRLYSTAKLDPGSLALYPNLAARCRTVYRPGLDKVVLFLEDGYREELKDSLRLDLALKPEITGMPETVLRTAGAIEIEQALTSETLVHLPHSSAATVEFLQRVSEEVPRAAVRLGTARASIPGVIQQALTTGVVRQDARGPSVKQMPFITVIVHFDHDDRAELRALAADIAAQGYPRTEFVVVATGPACGMTNEVSALPGTVQVFAYPKSVANANAWNRGVREAFAELLLLVEPGDRWSPGAFEVLAGAMETDPATPWVRGKILCDGSEPPGPLRGALIRKSAFREFGLFPAGPSFQGIEQRMWISRVEEKGLTGHSIETVTLRIRNAAPRTRGPASLRLEPTGAQRLRGAAISGFSGTEDLRCLAGSADGANRLLPPHESGRSEAVPPDPGRPPKPGR